MTEEKSRKFISSIKGYSKKATATKKSAEKVLTSAGILDKNGKIAKEYK